jgi:hypothetical protein
MITAFQTDIARFLAIQAIGRQRTTYPELARAVNWAHPQGRGLGRHLWEILNYTHDQDLPCLTAILCAGGTRQPHEGAIEYIRQVYGPLNIDDEQQRVFEFDWAAVAALAFEQPIAPEIDFNRIFATRTWGFNPLEWGMTAFSHEVTRDQILGRMAGSPIYVVYFCSQHSEPIEGKDGRFTIAPEDVARVLGIVEVQPEKATHGSHTAPEAVRDMLELWGQPRWPFGLANSRAWEFVKPPWTREALPHARSTSWEATRGLVELTDEEKRLIRQYALREVAVYGRELRPVAYALREPMHTTYLAVCEDPQVLVKTEAPAGTRLVKIGVSGDTDRRLRDLNDHHFARIFGLRFRMLATQRWASQDEALAREASALEWGLANAAQHASGEYFFMTDRQMMEAVTKVKPPKRVR